MASTTIVLILGVIASITLIISALSVHRLRLLTFSIVTTSLVAIQLLITHSAIATVLICAIGIVRTGVLILAEVKYPILNHWFSLVIYMTLYSSAFVFSTDFSTAEWYQWFPFVGSVVGTIAIFITNMAVTKTMAMSAGAFWTTYYIFNGMTTQLIGEIFTIGANAIALAMIIRARRSGIPEDQIKDIDDRLVDALTGGIDVITGTIKTHTQSNPVINTNTKPISIGR